MNVRKLVILGDNDRVKNHFIRSLLDLRQSNDLFPGIDRYSEVVEIENIEEKIEILNITGDPRYKQLASQNIIGAEYVWLVLGAENQSFEALHDWYKSADLFAYGAQPMVIVWQDPAKSCSLAQKDLLSFLTKIGLQDVCGVWLRAEDHLSFSDVFFKHFSAEYLARPKSKPVMYAQSNVRVSTNRLKLFLSRHVYSALAMPVFVTAFSAAAYFVWPLLLLNIPVTVLVVAVPLSIALISAALAVAFEKTREAFVGSCRNSTADILNKIGVGSEESVEICEEVAAKKSEIPESEPRLKDDVNASASQAIRLRR